MTAIKYSASKVNNTLKSNNIVLGSENAAYGPTSATGFYVGITSPASGYTIYNVNGVTHIPTAVVAHNDAECIWFARSFGGTNITTIGEALTHLLTGSTGTTVMNMDFPSIVTSGLTLCVDGDFVASYPKGGSTWYDLSSNNSNGNITAGSSFGNLSWANNITGLTISTVVEKTAYHTEYAYHPIQKWNNVTVNTSFVLYHFGDFSGNQQDGNFSFLYTSSDQGWVGNGVGTLVSGQTAYMCLQWNSITGGQAWLNGSKVGGRGGSGMLGVGGTTDLGIHGPETVGASKVHHAAFYNRDLSDSEVIQNFEALKHRLLVKDGLVLYLDAANIQSYSGSGTSWNDLSGNGMNATKYGDPLFQTDGGGCFNFSGATGIQSYNASMGFTFNSNMVPVIGDFTFECWVKTSQTMSQTTLFSNAGSGDGYRFGPGSTGIYVLVGPDYTEGPISNLNGTWDTSAWHHVVVLFDRSSQFRITYYLDSVYQNYKDIPTNQNTSANGVPGIVRNACCILWTGTLSIFNVYNRLLTGTEVIQNYSVLKSRFGL